MENSKRKGSRIVGAIIIFLILLFFAIEFFIRGTQQFSPNSVTNILLSTLQIIVFLLFLVLFFVLGRNLIRLYLERKRKVLGAKFKTKLILFFISLSLIPTLLLFMFASDLISRNIEHWFKTPIGKILDDTKNLADGFYVDNGATTLHYAKQLSQSIKEQNLIDPQSRLPLMEFVREKLKEYKLDEIGIYLDDEELFSYLNPNLPLQDYRDLKSNRVKRAHLGETLKTIQPMGTGEMIRRGVSFDIPDVGNILVVTGKFLPQNYAQSINNITSNVQRYRQLKMQKNPVKTFYLLTLIFITMLIIFAASWIGFHLAKGITVPIEKLAHATKEVSRGNLNVKVEDPASDELGTLIESFNQMMSDLKESRYNIAQKTSELEGRKQYIETILDNITTGVITMDAQGHITTINPSAQEMLELNKSQLIGEKYTQVLREEKYSEISKTIQKCLYNKYKFYDKEININFDHQISTFALTLSPLNQPPYEFSGIIVVLDNLTQLIKAQKFMAWKEMAQRVAHEIKNPLTPIQLSGERILKNLKKSGNKNHQVIEEGAQTIVREARAIKSLVDEFSTFARMPDIQLQPVDIHEIIEQTLTPFKGIFSHISFETFYSAEVPSTLSLDPEQMRRVFNNILDNAVDAVNKKGNIKISTSFDSSNQRVEVEISDSGPGVPPPDQEKLFLPHFSTKKKGTGLGLAIANQIIKEHNGSIEVKSDQQHGAKFIIQLPV
ncbi:HAMP domain-containing protein [bacterium]|nr:HAMP domain-containing protein [bacterium]